MTTARDNEATKAIQDYCNEVYYIDPVKECVEKLKAKGYIPIKVKEGCLLDDFALIHPDTIKAYINDTFNPRKVFTFKETYRNSQSSTYKLVRSKTLRKYHIECLTAQGFLN